MKPRAKPVVFPILALLFASLACNLITGEGSSGDAPTPDIALPTSAAETALPSTSTPEPTPEPTSEPTPAVALGQEYRYPPGGFAFFELPGWEIIDEVDFLVHQSPGADPDLGPAFLMYSSVFEEDNSLGTLFDNYLAEFGSAVEFGPPSDITVAGAPARRADLTGSTDDGTVMKGEVLVVQITPRQAFYLFGFAPDPDWVGYVSGYFQAFTGSLSFFEPEAGAIPPDITGDVLRQWAVYAYASSEYTDSSWSALQAAGAPDAYPDCGDLQEAWAPLTYGTVDWLELTYDTPVYVTEVNIYETYNPGQVTAVDLLDVYGTYHEIYNAAPEALSDCSSILTIYPELDVPVIGVVIYVDTFLINDWTEIDAVELVGIPASE